MGRLDGKVAIVTGAARGMGAVEARLFVAEGAKVVLADVRDEMGEAVAGELGDAAIYVHLDVSDEEQWAAAVSAAQERFDRLDVLVNNAGIALPGSIEDLPLEDYLRTVAVNQTGTWLGIRAAAPAMRASGGGSIVNISSTAGRKGSADLGAYSTTKWAVRGMTKTAAMELVKDNIRVNSVHPGLVATDMASETGLSGEKIESVLPMGRAGRPDEIAYVVLFLASDESSYCSGAEFVADGAMISGG